MGLQLSKPQIKTPTPAPPRISSDMTLNYKHQHWLLAGLQLHDIQLETPTASPPQVSSTMTLSKKHQHRILHGTPAPRSSTRNTNTGSSVGLQLHNPQLETPTMAPPCVSNSKPSTRNTNDSSSTDLQLHDPQTRKQCSTLYLPLHKHQLETPTAVPPRVSSSKTVNYKHQHGLLRRSPAPRSSIRNNKTGSSTGLQLRKPQTRKQRITLYLQLHNSQRETPTMAPPQVSNFPNLN
ncbi:uncharacterized protein LOC126957448 isoform X1 [Macaca thibetana thibetana]|uniref:uncharacterized protein LOC126957448 isoform X1 n=1 Tax=Macaca thibetana thibetana TaxID=257877 RepID=UPI0021BCB28E|nr:uncharacterized protein LOC126957448 isoform X1 [Macaca thibetana thibetana]XP_050651322.1 uncharacterized protein LOC126957448 isoform X1 [Macaca thibetana thibetana]XP_050651323.1 uncharacterized protein LOC126957448 isoform X1 [Macaca thibetana thibetana]XP_050651324.1 uncharacterized protein LOC126957448 isoform X1 [Macaca thibetana thibetana]XP_050651325.1 uncharacterized protein LOC126957448 isoform X1 [Macaca thibetana thibetana]